MLLEELVEQHRVHRVVTNCVHLVLAVTSHQIRVHLFHFLGHKAKLRDSSGINSFLVMEGYRFKRQNRFTRFIHRLDRLLETPRGRRHAKLTEVVYHHWIACNGCSADPGDKSSLLSSCPAYAGGGGF